MIWHWTKEDTPAVGCRQAAGSGANSRAGPFGNMLRNLDEINL